MRYILIVYLAYTIDCVAVQKMHVFMQSRRVLDRQEHVLHRNKCGNLMLTLRYVFVFSIYIYIYIGCDKKKKDILNIYVKSQIINILFF